VDFARSIGRSQVPESGGRAMSGGWANWRVCAAIVLPCLAGCAGNPSLPGGNPIELPYSACGPMTDLRNNLTGTSDASPKTDALLHRLGVRCIGEGPPAIRARF
jgi:hypothetical protein